VAAAAATKGRPPSPGSLVSKNIEDYYTTPYALGYGPFIKFDHDFIGRERWRRSPGRIARRFTLPERRGSAEVLASLLVPGGENYKYFDLPNCNYASSSFDKVLMGGKTVGFSMFGGYSYSERTALSLGIVDPEIEIGDVLTLLWGEEHGGTHKTTVEPHKQLEIRVRVSPTPYAQAARAGYHEGWRTRQS
jgi:vanillate/3-O-methylgallate O-demethylase